MAAAMLLLAGAGAGRADDRTADELDALLAAGDDAPGREAPEPARPQTQSAADDPVGSPATVPVTPLRPEPTPPPDARSGRVIEEIVVTAQKTEQSLRDVPISVSAIGGEQIKESAIVDAQDLVQYTPNVRFSQGINSIPTINIRGFGSPPLGRNLEPSVGLSIDDVFYGRSTFTADGIFDVERVEVLRGPQGTLFGKNTIAGVLSFTTAEPSFEPNGYLTVATGSYSEKRVEGGIGFGLIDEVLAVRLSFRARDRETGMYNTLRDETNEAQDIAGRLKLRWQITDDLTADLGGFVAAARSTGAGFELQRASPRELTRYRQIDPDADDEPYNGRQSINEATYSNRDSRSVSLRLNRYVGEFGILGDLDTHLILADAQVKTPYFLDTDFSPIDSQSLASDGPESYTQRSFEARATATTPGLFDLGVDTRWIVGVYGQQSESRVSQFSVVNLNGVIDTLIAGGSPYMGWVPQVPEELRALLASLGLPTDISDLPAPVQIIPQQIAEEFTLNRTDVDSRTLAFFAQATWQLTERFGLTLGYRFGRERKSGAQSSQCLDRPACIAVAAFAGQRNFSVSSTRDEIERSPKIALSYEFNDAVMVFANATKGFKSGGYSGPLLAPINLEYEPESAISYEAGAKTRLLDGSLVLNASVFRVEFDDLQVNLFDGTNISTLNAATAVSQGLEIDFQWLPPLEFLTLAGSFGLTDVAYGHFPCGPALAGDTDTSPECNPDNEPRPPPTQDLTGRETPFTPRLSASFTPTLRFPVWPRRNLGGLFGVDVLYQGEQYLDADLDPNSFQAATTKINARLGIGPEDRRWSIVFNVKNMTGERERALVIDKAQYAGSYVTIAYPDEPTYALDLRYNFGD